MADDKLTEQHDRFLAGAPGRCVVCGSEEAFSWTDSEEIDAGVTSHHDTWHFLWLDDGQQDQPHGFICDACIDRLEKEGRIEAYYSEMSGPRSGLSEAAAAVAFELGARRMRTMIGVPTDEDGMVRPDTLAALPPSLRQRRRSIPVPLWELVAGFARRRASDDDPEGAGRLHALAKAAVGASAGADIAAEAKAWARKRSERQTKVREIDRLLSESGAAFSPEQEESPLPHEAADRERLRGLLMEGASSPATEPIDDRYFESLRDRIQNGQKTSTDKGNPDRKHHPDSHELDDWPLYGPKSGTIFDLVSRLAYEKGMRVADIEKLIEEALQSKLR